MNQTMIFKLVKHVDIAFRAEAIPQNRKPSPDLLRLSKKMRASHSMRRLWREKWSDSAERPGTRARRSDLIRAETAI
jgi:hypothetical protein